MKATIKLDKNDVVDLNCNKATIIENRTLLSGLSIEDINKALDTRVATNYDNNGLWMHNRAVIVLE